MIPIYYIKDAETDAVVNSLKIDHGMHDLLFKEVIPTRETMYTWFKPDFRLHIEERRAVLIWGEGGLHGYSYFFSPDEPFSKSVDDAHLDLGHAQGSVSCANHNSYLLRKNSNLSYLEVLGFNKKIEHPLQEGILEDERLFITTSMETTLKDKVVHKSIDLDVIEYYPCSDLWIQSSTTPFNDVLSNFKALVSKNDVVRLDLGGLDLESLNSDLVDPNLAFKAYAEILKIYIEKYN